MEQTKKNKKEAKDEKMKDQKLEEQIIKSLEDAKTPEDKFKSLLTKYMESERTNRKFKQDIKIHEKQLETIMREKENLQREYNKNVLMRDKLEEVCREQQKLIKSVKNESMAKIREEEERRKESQQRFQTSLHEINQSLNKNNDENNKLRDHNIEMTKKLKYLAEQYQAREQQLEKLNEQVQLESQLHQAKLSKVQVESAMEKEILIKEKHIALEKLMNTQKLLKEITEREKELKEQLNIYTAKYDVFQNSLQKSNDVFSTYKVELEKMSKNTRKLEKEAMEWKRKWEKSNATLIELATEKKDRDDHAMRCNKQVDQLQKLLRALQNERSHLYKVIKENNIEVPALPALPTEPETMQTGPIKNVADKDKMDMMSKNCAELKQTLANLQSQMKILNIKGAEAEQQCKQLQAQEETIKKKKNKKSKSKKNNHNNNNANKESSPAISEDTTSVKEEEEEEAETKTKENGNTLEEIEAKNEDEIKTKENGNTLEENEAKNEEESIKNDKEILTSQVTEAANALTTSTTTTELTKATEVAREELIIEELPKTPEPIVVEATN